MITKTDYLIGGLVGFLSGIAAIPTVYNVGSSHSAVLLLALPWIGAAVFVAGIWAAALLSRSMPFFVQFSKFIAVGFLNTAIDFGILNLLSRVFGVSAGLILGGVNIPGFVVAVSNSYFWNKFWVFGNKNGGKLFDDLPKFLAVTVIGIFINSGIIILVTSFVQPMFGLSAALWLNLAKVGATVITLIWNFSGYKLFVFRSAASPAV